MTILLLGPRTIRNKVNKVPPVFLAMTIRPMVQAILLHPRRQLITVRCNGRTLVAGAQRPVPPDRTVLIVVPRTEVRALKLGLFIAKPRTLPFRVPTMPIPVDAVNAGDLSTPPTSLETPITLTILTHTPLTLPSYPLETVDTKQHLTALPVPPQAIL